MAEDDAIGDCSSCTAFVAHVLRRQRPMHRNTQLCVVSLGFDLEGVLAQVVLQHHRVTQNAQPGLYFVVLPDTVASGGVSGVAVALRQQLHRYQKMTLSSPSTADASLPPSQGDVARGEIPVTAIEDGSSTKERCAAFLSGGVVVVACRLLCADILHRRVAVDLIHLAAFSLPHRYCRLHDCDSITLHAAFCIELLLQRNRLSGSALAAEPARSLTASALIITDAPFIAQHLLWRHQLGLERFLQQLHVGDIQLFPRFRLDFVQHFERLAAKRPSTSFAIDRIVAPTPASLVALDEILRRILLETLHELWRMELQLEQQQPPQNATPASSSGGLDADDEVASQRFLPRARLDPSMSHDRLQHDLRSSRRHTATSQRTPREASSYIRPSWRRVGSEGGLHFGGISEAAALELATSGLDEDLRAALHHRNAAWSYRALIESLCDIRRLRRAARESSHYFFFALQASLEKRLPRRSVYGAGPPPPAALWTLSPLFDDLLTVATHRIGTLHFQQRAVPATGGGTAGSAMEKSASGTAGAAPPYQRRTVLPPSPSLVVVDSDDEESEVELIPVGASKSDASAAAVTDSRTAPPTQLLVPPTECQDMQMEAAVRLVWSWCRTALRRSQSRRQPTALTAPSASFSSLPNTTSAATTPATGMDAGPTVAAVILLPNAAAVVRCVERLLSSSVHDYQTTQLNHFLQKYQTKYGVCLRSGSASKADTNSNSSRTATATAAGQRGAVVPEDLLTQLLPLPLNGRHGSSDEDSTTEEEEEGDRAAEEDAPSEGENREGFKASQRHRTAANRGVSHSNRAAAGRPDMDHGDVSGTTPVSAMAGAFHEALLSQVPLATATSGNGLEESAVGTAKQQQMPGVAEVAIRFVVERVQRGTAILVAKGMGDPTAAHSIAWSSSRSSSGTSKDDLGLPRIVVCDGASLAAAELMALLDGSHPLLDMTVPMAKGEVSSPLPSRTLQVRRLVIVRQRLEVLRQLEMAQDTLPASLLAMLKVQLVTTAMEEEEFAKVVEAERLAFERLAHSKATLTGTLLVDQSSLRRTEEELESGMLVARRLAGSQNSASGWRRRQTAVARLGGDFIGAAAATSSLSPLPSEPCIIFDEREFRSMLPYYLYCRGVALVPLTLRTADYILSPHYAVERKGVPDLIQSLKSGRIWHQLASLSRKYESPICLVEFRRHHPFQLLCQDVYPKMARLIVAYPRVMYLWSRSPAHGAAMLLLLKKSVAVENQDPSDPSLTGSGGSGDAAAGSGVGGSLAAAAEKEASHYAARILSLFPGLTPQNAPRVMQLCGSLVGLATISEASLVSVMGEENGKRLHEFVHSKFHEEV